MEFALGPDKSLAIILMGCEGLFLRSLWSKTPIKICIFKNKRIFLLKNFADLKFEICATVFGTTFPTGDLNRSLIINNLIKVRSQPRRAIISQTTADYR